MTGLRIFKDLKVGETFRFINSAKDFVKVSDRRYREVEGDLKIIRVGTIYAKIED